MMNRVFKQSNSNLLHRVLLPEEKMKINLCSRCLCSHSYTTSRYNGVKRGLDNPQKRKILRQIKTDIYTKNMSDPDMEKAARTRKLLVPLDDVRQGWIPKKYPHQVMTMASYYGIYDHMFDGIEFTPTAVMDIDYGDVLVHYGNFIEPVKTSSEPKVTYNGSRFSLATLLMVNLDGNILSKNQEVLHWMVGNIPNGDISKGEVLSGYLPPCPVKGTGFHRVVFCLLNQTAQCDFGAYTEQNSRNLASRSFTTRAFLETFQDKMEPVGLSFFQATWDKSVTNTFTEILGKQTERFFIFHLDSKMLSELAYPIHTFNCSDLSTILKIDKTVKLRKPNGKFIWRQLYILFV